MEHALVLEGRRTRLEPLTGENFAGVRAAGSDPALWQFTFQTNPFTSPTAAEHWYAGAMEDRNAMAFAIVDKESGEIAGSSRYLDISREHRKLEIGWTFLAPRFWRTHVNTEAKFLLLQHAFEQWNAQRIQLKAEAINKRSHEAILRIGAVHEGTLRSFRIRGDGQVRDVAFYSIIAPEWPAAKARLLSFLDRIPGSREAV
jgi:RimJ/RimL family protein N-acetyltransferase